PLCVCRPGATPCTGRRSAPPPKRRRFRNATSGSRRLRPYDQALGDESAQEVGKAVRNLARLEVEVQQQLRLRHVWQRIWQVDAESRPGADRLAEGGGIRRQSPQRLTDVLAAFKQFV